MTDLAIARSRSAAALRRSHSVDARPTLLVSSPVPTRYLTRTRSVPDITSYFRYSDKYKPQWHSIYTYTPYKWRRDYDLVESKWFDRLIKGKYDDYWYDRYYYFSPLYRSTYPSRRYYYSDYLPNPYYWSPYSNYWTRYKGYWYDYDYPSYYRRSYDSAFSRYLSSTYTPYRSYLYDSLSTSLARGLSMYRAGVINYNTLENYWLTPTYWDKRFKDWRELYCTYDKTCTNDLPSYYNRRAREYFTTWKNS